MTPPSEREEARINDDVLAAQEIEVFASADEGAAQRMRASRRAYADRFRERARLLRHAIARLLEMNEPQHAFPEQKRAAIALCENEVNAARRIADECSDTDRATHMAALERAAGFDLAARALRQPEVTEEMVDKAHDAYTAEGMRLATTTGAVKLRACMRAALTAAIGKGG